MLESALLWTLTDRMSNAGKLCAGLPPDAQSLLFMDYSVDVLRWHNAVTTCMPGATFVGWACHSLSISTRNLGKDNASTCDAKQLISAPHV